MSFKKDLLKAGDIFFNVGEKHMVENFPLKLYDSEWDNDEFTGFIILNPENDIIFEFILDENDNYNSTVEFIGEGSINIFEEYFKRVKIDIDGKKEYLKFMRDRTI